MHSAATQYSGNQPTPLAIQSDIALVLVARTNARRAQSLVWTADSIDTTIRQLCIQAVARSSPRGLYASLAKICQ